MGETQANERPSTWGVVICGNIWMTCDVQPLGFITGGLFLLLAVALIWTDKAPTERSE